MDDRRLLRRNECRMRKIPLLFEEIRGSSAEAFFIIEADPKSLKLLTVELEEQHPLGRIFDFDVFAPEYHQVNRTSLGLRERSCLICEERAALCRRSKRHSMEDLLKSINEMIRLKWPTP